MAECSVIRRQVWKEIRCGAASALLVYPFFILAGPSSGFHLEPRGHGVRYRDGCLSITYSVINNVPIPFNVSYLFLYIANFFFYLLKNFLN